MPQFSRRDFISLSSAALIAGRSAFGSGEDIPEQSRATIEALERAACIARRRSISSRTTPRQSFPHLLSRSAGGLHDYFSEADYFWANPKNPRGPYINRDGESNPANFNAHRLLLIRLSIQMPALAAAWLLTKRKDFAAHAAHICAPGSLNLRHAWIQISNMRRRCTASPPGAAGASSIRCT